MLTVASYCRVSTDQEDQTNSFDSQRRYFREYIRHHPDWELYQVYADQGITGTSTKKRTQFNRMIQDAHDGKFGLILTKEVSRFSRNILDTIRYTRELKAIGVAVLFLTDGINTLDPDAELRLSIMASVAQEESRKTSSRVTWGQTRQMERGVVFGRSLLGYDVGEGKLSINPAGAEIVKLIFHKYALEQMGTAEIATWLTHQGFRTQTGSTNWRGSTIIKILHNEKYAGDLIQKKTYTPDYLTHEKRSNKGAVPLIIIQDHHEPIISREVWNMAQERLRVNNKHTLEGQGHSHRYIFSGKIKCGECGASFVGGFKYLKDGTKIRRWSCPKKGCGIGKLIRDDDAMLMLTTSIRHLSMDTNTLIQNVTDLTLTSILKHPQSSTDDPAELRSGILRVRKKKESVLDSYFGGEISMEDMQSMKLHYEQQLEDLARRLAEAEERCQSGPDAEQLRQTIRAQISAILSGEIVSEAFFKNMLNRLTVYKDRHMELRLASIPFVFHFF